MSGTSGQPTEVTPTEAKAHNDDETSGRDLEPGLPQENPAPRYSIFTRWQKRAIVLCAALAAFFSPLSAQIYLPALNPISEDLGVSGSEINLTITTYMVIQGTMPMLVGSMADSGGRRPAYIFCFIVYIAANIGLALAPNYGAVLGLRCLQSAGSSSTVALCSAVVADIATSAERASYVAITAVPGILAPALGPVVGGLLSQFLGWRSIFWFLAILAGVALVFVAVFFPETCRPIVDDGSVPPPPVYRTVWQLIRQCRERRTQASPEKQLNQGSDTKRFKFKPPNVLGSLLMLLEKETGVLLSTASISYAGFYALAAAMPSQFADQYGLSETEVGLAYLPLAAGSVIAASITGPAMTWNYKRHCSKLGLPFDRSRQQDLAGFPIEKVRLQVGLPLMALAGAALVGWGWSVQAHAHFAAPCILSALLGIGMVGFNNAATVLLVDIHPGKAGTATAANNFTRCLVGAGATAAISPMIDAMGQGWAFTLMGVLYDVCIAVLCLVLFRGTRWRAETRKQGAA